MRKLDLVDFFKFLSTSLEKLVHNLSKEVAKKIQAPQTVHRAKESGSWRYLCARVFIPTSTLTVRRNSTTLVLKIDQHFTVALATEAYQNRIMFMPKCLKNIPDV